jgi:transposase
MSRFPTSGHLAHVQPGCVQAITRIAGKRLSGKTRKGSPWLRKLLVEAAHAAAHTKNTSLSAFSQRIKARQGAKQAAIAVGHTLLVICYHVLDRQVSYEELGGNYLDEHDRQATEKRLVRRLEKLGYRVELQPASQVA